MVNRAIVSTNQITEGINCNHYDVKRAIRFSFNEIQSMIADYADPDKPLIIDGQKFEGKEKYEAAATLTLQNKFEQLQNRSTTILGIFDALFKLQNKLGS